MLETLNSNWTFTLNWLYLNLLQVHIYRLYISWLMMYFTIMSSVTTRRKSSCHSHGETTRQFISPCGSLGEICQSWNYMKYVIPSIWFIILWCKTNILSDLVLLVFGKKNPQICQFRSFRILAFVPPGLYLKYSYKMRWLKDFFCQ